jgi:uncharacterized protein (TIGR03435 family)
MTRLANRAVIAAIALLAVVPVRQSVAQSTARPAFEAATLKLNTGCNAGRSVPMPGRLSLKCTTLRTLLRTAYGTFANGPMLRAARMDVLGGPPWLDSDMYDLDAKAEAGAPLDQMAGPMLRALLEDRCKAKVHKDTREVPVYALTVAKGGAKMLPTKAGSCTPLDINHLPARPGTGEPQQNFCGVMSTRNTASGMTADGKGLTMAELAARLLSGTVDRPVIDKTGLAGMFDIHLEYAPDNTMGVSARLNGEDAPALAAPPSDAAGLSIFTAIQQQLGLKLSPEKGPIEVLIVDSIERPSEN